MGSPCKAIVSEPPHYIHHHQCQRAYEAEQIATLTAELEAARALLAHREGIWQEAIAKRDRNLEAARASFKGACDESAKTLEQLDAARRDIGRLRAGINEAVQATSFMSDPYSRDISVKLEALLTAQPASATEPDAPCPNCGEMCGDRGAGHMIGKPSDYGCSRKPQPDERALERDGPPHYLDVSGPDGMRLDVCPACLHAWPEGHAEYHGDDCSAQQQPQPEAGGQDREGVGEPREL